MNEINDQADMFFNIIEKQVMDLGGKGGTQLILQQEKKGGEVLKNFFLPPTHNRDPNARTASCRYEKVGHRIGGRRRRWRRSPDCHRAPAKRGRRVSTATSSSRGDSSVLLPAMDGARRRRRRKSRRRREAGAPRLLRDSGRRRPPPHGVRVYLLLE